MIDHSKTDKVLMRAKDIGLIISIIILAGYVIGGAKKISAWDKAAEVCEKNTDQIYEIHKTIAVQTEILTRMERTLDRMSRNRGRGGD